MSGERILEMVRKEFRQLFRDPRLRRIIFVAPILQLIVFGYAVSTDVRNTSTLVVDADSDGIEHNIEVPPKGARAAGS